MTLPIYAWNEIMALLNLGPQGGDKQLDRRLPLTLKNELKELN